MAQKKHTVTFDGHVFKRGSANRSYTHAVIRAFDIAVKRSVRS